MTSYTTLPMDPLDLRNPANPVFGIGHILDEQLDDQFVPSLAKMAGRPFEERLSPDVHHSVTVIDGLAFRIMFHLQPPPEEASAQPDKPLEDTLSRIETAPENVRQRFCIAVVLHLHQRALWSKERPSIRLVPHLAERMRTRVTRMPGLDPILPTIDRIDPTAGYLDPESTARLRSAGWRDAAGRDIDTSLLAGHLRFLWDSLPPSPREPDQGIAIQLDSRLRLGPLTLKDLLLRRGMILSQVDRQALAAAVRAPDGNSAVFHLNAAPLMARAFSTVDRDQLHNDLRECLSIDRANRLAAEPPSAGPEPDQAPYAMGTL